MEELEVYCLALEYLDVIYRLTEELPRSEAFNLREQMIRAGTSVVLNIAETAVLWGGSKFEVKALIVGISRFEDIQAWRVARELCKVVYQFTGDEKFHRDFGLCFSGATRASLVWPVPESL